MSTALLILICFVFPIMFIGNVVETRARKPPPSPQQDLRIAYAPDLKQALEDEAMYYVKEQMKDQIEAKRRIEEKYATYHRELENAKVKRWLEGNPVTEENPLTKKELPTLPRHEPNPYISTPFL